MFHVEQARVPRGTKENEGTVTLPDDTLLHQNVNESVLQNHTLLLLQAHTYHLQPKAKRQVMVSVHVAVGKLLHELLDRFK